MSRKILAFGGSTSQHSINKKLATYAARLFEKKHQDVEVDLIDLNDYPLPVFSVDIEKPFPASVVKFAEKIDAADLIVISLAEHNGSYSAAFKNIFDWTSRMPGREAWAGKKMFLLATSPGARGGSLVLETAKNRFPRNGGVVLETFSLPSFNENFKEGEGITNKELDQQLKNLIQKIEF